MRPDVTGLVNFRTPRAVLSTGLEFLLWVFLFLCPEEDADAAVEFLAPAAGPSVSTGAAGPE